MPSTLEYLPVIEKLLGKSRQGRLPWETAHYRQFRCTLDQYTFAVSQTDSGYSLNMLDSDQNEIFSINVQDEVLFMKPENETLYNELTELYELARRKALKVDEKLAGVSALLDRV
jgi:hypothetical protein